MGQDPDEVDRLLRAIMPHAPEVLHHVFALEGRSLRSFLLQISLTRSLGANEVLLGLNSVESKAGYLVQIIAVELYKASKAISPKVWFCLSTVATRAKVYRRTYPLVQMI